VALAPALDVGREETVLSASWLEVDGGWRGESDPGLQSERRVWERLLGAGDLALGVLVRNDLPLPKHWRSVPDGRGPYTLVEMGVVLKDASVLQEVTMHGQPGDVGWIVRQQLAEEIVSLYARPATETDPSGLGFEPRDLERAAFSTSNKALVLTFFNEGYGVFVLRP
jgi:hypothetical protein